MLSKRVRFSVSLTLFDSPKLANRRSDFFVKAGNVNQHVKFSLPSKGRVSVRFTGNSSPKGVFHRQTGWSFSSRSRRNASRSVIPEEEKEVDMFSAAQGLIGEPV